MTASYEHYYSSCSHADPNRTWLYLCCIHQEASRTHNDTWVTYLMFLSKAPKTYMTWGGPQLPNSPRLRREFLGSPKHFFLSKSYPCLLSCYVTQLGLHPNSTDQIDQPLISQTGLWISVTTPKWNPPTKEECLSQLSYSLKWVTRSERNTPKKVVSERLGTMEQHWNMSKTIVALRASSSTPERMSACSCHLAPQLPCLF